MWQSNVWLSSQYVKKLVSCEEAYLEKAMQLFSHIKISAEGRKYLGFFIRTEQGKAMLEERIEEWWEEVNSLAATRAE